MPHPAWYLVLGAVAGRPDFCKLLSRRKGFVPGGPVSAVVVLLKGLVPVGIATLFSSGPMLPVATAIAGLLAHLLTSGRRLLLWYILGATLGLRLWELAAIVAAMAFAARYVDHLQLLYLTGPTTAGILLVAPGWFSEDAHTAWLVVAMTGILIFLARGVIKRYRGFLNRLVPAGLIVASLVVFWGLGQVNSGRSGFARTVVCPQILSGSPTGGLVALTFDDGPDPLYTPKVLRLLRQADVKATFFVVGSKVLAHPEIVAQIVADGHTIGNHSHTHRNLSTMGTQQLAMEIDLAQDAIEQACGIRPHLMRPPRGMGSPELFRLLTERGMTLALWSKSSQDWLQPTPSGIVASLGKAVRSGDILLFHDSGDFFKSSGASRAGTLSALPGIIVALKTRGLQLVTMDDIIEQALVLGWDMGVPEPSTRAALDVADDRQPGRGVWALLSQGAR
ncbi:MAG: polysaccharide deacetylase family protein [Bacillota bacterium]|nr:polysaccharide deacetylase family protein [Bacillota bacterium]